MVRQAGFVFGMLGILGALGACMDGNTPVSKDTRITPDVFQYATIIEAPADGSTGGWRAVCVKVRLDQRTAPSQQGAPAECDLEYGTPIVNHQHGHIPLHKAQRISAEVSNEVGRRVLEKARDLTEITCRKLRTGMNKGMDKAIKGSKVTKCGVTDWSRPVPEVVWPPPG
jgi:hypothetical protein